jgi:hypothetical protein
MPQNTPPFLPGGSLQINPDRRIQELRSKLDKTNTALAEEIANGRPIIKRISFGYRDVQNTAPGVYQKIKFADIAAGTVILQAFAWTSEIFTASAGANTPTNLYFSVGYRQFKGAVVGTEDRDGVLIEKDCLATHRTWSAAADKGSIFGASYKDVPLISARDRGELILAVKAEGGAADLSLFTGGKLQVMVVVAEP